MTSCEDLGVADATQGVAVTGCHRVSQSTTGVCRTWAWGVCRTWAWGVCVAHRVCRTRWPGPVAFAANEDGDWRLLWNETGCAGGFEAALDTRPRSSGGHLWRTLAP